MSRALAAEPSGPVASARANVRRMVRGARGNLAEIRQLLDAARARLRDRAAGASEADAAFSRAMLLAVDEEVRRLDAELRDPMHRTLVDPLTAGDVDMLSAAQDAVGPGRFVGIAGVDPVLLDFASQDSADLVRQITEGLRARLNLTMRAAATGSVTTEQVAAQIGEMLTSAGRSPGIFGTIYSQTARVLRTETGKLYQGAIAARQERLAMDTGMTLQKRWVKTILGADRDRPSHIALNGATIPVGEHFNVGPFGEAAQVSHEEAQRRGMQVGEAAVGPLDPALSAQESVNCTCTSITVFPEPQT